MSVKCPPPSSIFCMFCHSHDLETINDQGHKKCNGCGRELNYKVWLKSPEWPDPIPGTFFANEWHLVEAEPWGMPEEAKRRCECLVVEGNTTVLFDDVAIFMFHEPRMDVLNMRVVYAFHEIPPEGDAKAR